MNLFVVGWNLTPTQRRRAASALTVTVTDYPLLDTSTHYTHIRGPLFASSITHSLLASAPRVYVAKDDFSLTLYDGCPVDPNGAVRAHDAGELGVHWHRLTDTLEGQFVAARLDKEDHSLEILTDPLGIHQTYYAELNHACLVSNSARLLALASGSQNLDAIGAARFLNMGWVGGDRTVNEGVKVVPGAQCWKWSETRGIERRTYWDLASTTRRSTKGRFGQATKVLGDAFGGMLGELDSFLGPLECPITAGRDSRMMVGTTLHYGVSATYFTGGVAQSADVRIGSNIARTFSLPHKVRGGDPNELFEGWDVASRRLVAQNDGMVTLAHVRNANAEPDALEKLGVQLYGAGGAIARGWFSDARSLIERPTSETVRRRILRMLAPPNPFLKKEAARATTQFVNDAVDELLARNIRVEDVPDALVVAEYERRWAGTQFRQIASRTAVFSPFCTRPYTVAAFSVPPAQRYAELVPDRLLSYLSPELHRIPYEKPWPPRSLAGLLFLHLPSWTSRKVASRASRIFKPNGSGRGRKPGRGREREQLLEEKRLGIRSLCLDQSSSPLWELVDRTQFERVMSDDYPREQRVRQYRRIFNIATLFLYATLDSELEPSHSSASVHRLSSESVQTEYASTSN